MIKDYISFLKKLRSPILLALLGFVIYISLSITHMERQLLKNIDLQLLTAAQNIKYYVGEDYVTKDINETTYSKEEIIDKGALLDSIAKKTEIDYLYILVKKENDIRYALMSDLLEELIENPTAYYWLSLKDAQDDSYLLTSETFGKDEPVFLNSTDKWDSYRSVYLPQISSDGTPYIAGADITISHLRKNVISWLVLGAFRSLIFLTLSLPLICAFMRLKKENIATKNKIINLNEMDHLTKTFNRNKGLEILENIIKKDNLQDSPVSLCLVDIQNLAHINNKLGIAAGDKLIKIVGNILSSNFRKTDAVVRFEGDKFIVILKGCKADCRAALIKSLQNRLSLFNTSNKKNYYLKLHMLFCAYKGETAQEFIEKAFHQLNLHKKKQSTTDAIIQEEIIDGLNRNEFRTFFQPKVFTREKQIEFEALIRWFHPKKGLIPPDKFIPISEKSFVIHNLTKKVLKDAVDFSQKTNTKVSVNISPVVFQNPNFSKEIKEILNTREIAELIVLEITEGIALDNFKVAVNKMKELNGIGVEFSIDDFGIGYSSLSYLEKLPIAELKIDKLFVRNIHTDKINPLIINFVVKVGKISGFKVIAEGVETEDHIKTLTSLGCHNFQGYYFDKPQSAEVIYEKYSSPFYLNMIEKLKR